jgi:hypothetical protein
VLYDPILAYQFIYPVQTSAGGELRMTLSHPPEKVRVCVCVCVCVRACVCVCV